MIGWAAATGSLGVEPILLFLIIFLWTPPHFWALSLYRKEDYAPRGHSDAAGGRRRSRNAPADPALHADPGSALGIAPWLLGYASGSVYGTAACALGAIMMALALRVRAEKKGYAASKQLFAFSILYLFLLFALLLIDRVSGGACSATSRQWR